LARAGHSVTVYEKSDRVGGLLRYGIPDFKMEKVHIDRRITQMEAEGVVFKTNVNVGVDISAKELRSNFDAVILALGSETPRDLPVEGRSLKGVYYAMDFLTKNNKKVAGDTIEIINAKDKNVIVIGGGDTGSDCVGTSNRHGAKNVTQIEIFSEPPSSRDPSTPWPYYPRMLRTSSSHEEGVTRKWSVNTLGFKGNEKGEVTAIFGNQVELKDGKPVVVDGTEFEWPADLVLFAMGFVHPVKEGLLSQLIEEGLELDKMGNVKAPFGDKDGDQGCD
jgi:glutamate synthase (NADPH/NADH) small chain